MIILDAPYKLMRLQLRNNWIHSNRRWITNIWRNGSWFLNSKDKSFQSIGTVAMLSRISYCIEVQLSSESNFIQWIIASRLITWESQEVFQFKTEWWKIDWPRMNYLMTDFHKFIMNTLRDEDEAHCEVYWGDEWKWKWSIGGWTQTTSPNQLDELTVHQR